MSTGLLTGLSATPDLEGRPSPRRALPCQQGEPDLWFADNPADLERAKALCGGCPARLVCLAAALDRKEPWGVWGGEIFEMGAVIAVKRPRGRPRKVVAASAA